MARLVRNVYLHQHTHVIAKRQIRYLRHTHMSGNLFCFLYCRATQRNNTLAWAGDCVSSRLMRSHYQVLRGGYRESWDAPTSQKLTENFSINPQTQNIWDLQDALTST